MSKFSYYLYILLSDAEFGLQRDTTFWQATVRAWVPSGQTDMGAPVLISFFEMGLNQ